MSFSGWHVDVGIHVDGGIEPCGQLILLIEGGDNFKSLMFTPFAIQGLPSQVGSCRAHWTLIQQSCMKVIHFKSMTHWLDG